MGNNSRWDSPKDRLSAAVHDAYMQRRLSEAEHIVAQFAIPAEQLACLLYAFLLYQAVDRDATVAFQREIATLAVDVGFSAGTVRAAPRSC